MSVVITWIENRLIVGATDGVSAAPEITPLHFTIAKISKCT